ncbi:MAG: helix-turn-helix domain-containing protein [Bacteroidota bacterium]
MNHQTITERMTPEEILDEHSLALSFALETNQHIFLTGKAGSGKTTLLKKIADKSAKNFVIAAPTGVAAINAGGVTIHSLFHLPTTCLIPSNDFIDATFAANRGFLVSHLRFSKEKKKVLEELELLIIDEVSMVRADILDAIDFALQFVRRNKAPFGGVQVLLIGDMHQLPPVTRDHDWEILKKYYTSPYFFDSLVWKKLDAVQIELKKIYRQQDERFVSILNNVRDKQLEIDDYEQLDKRYQPGYKPAEKGYIILTTHNKKADLVNDQELKILSGKMHSFPAKIEGEFPENMYPCDPALKLKEGAQVMFIKNDVESGQYFNGKLAQVKSISGDTVVVTFNDTKETFTLFRETWENITYNIEKGTGKINKNELGTFTQYPLRLAWAITIHKSQGLTFDKVIIDAGQSFAAGQVYVALSRCRTLEGIVLHSRITQSALFNDEKINSFSQTHHKPTELQNTLSEARARYANQLLIRLFSFNKILQKIEEWKEVILGKEIPEKESVLNLNENLRLQAQAIIETSDKFQNQLLSLLRELVDDPTKLSLLKERCSKAIDYFTGILFNSIVKPLHVHSQSIAFKAKVKRYYQHVQELEDFCWLAINRLYNSNFLNEKLFEGESTFIRTDLKTVETSVTKKKTVKGGTYLDTLILHKQNKSFEEIAVARGLAMSTIKGHFALLIKDGKVDITTVLPESTINEIRKLLVENPQNSVTGIKTQVGEKYDFAEIRMVFNDFHRKD